MRVPDPAEAGTRKPRSDGHPPPGPNGALAGVLPSSMPPTHHFMSMLLQGHRERSAIQRRRGVDVGNRFLNRRSLPMRTSVPLAPVRGQSDTGLPHRRDLEPGRASIPAILVRDCLYRLPAAHQAPQRAAPPGVGWRHLVAAGVPSVPARQPSKRARPGGTRRRLDHAAVDSPCPDAPRTDTEPLGPRIEDGKVAVFIQNGSALPINVV